MAASVRALLDVSGAAIVAAEAAYLSQQLTQIRVLESEQHPLRRVVAADYDQRQPASLQPT